MNSRPTISDDVFTMILMGKVRVESINEDYDRITVVDTQESTMIVSVKYTGSLLQGLVQAACEQAACEQADGVP